MLDKNAQLIIKTIIERPMVELSYIQTQTTLSKRQIDYSVEKINVWLKDEGQEPLVNEHKVVKVSQKTKHFLMHALSETLSDIDYTMNAKERQKYVFLLLFYFEDDYLSVNHLVDALKVGKTTILNDLKSLSYELSDSAIQILYNRKTGYSLCGSEFDIRYYLMKMINWDFSSSNTTIIYDCFIDDHCLESFEAMKKMIQQSIDAYDISFVENRLNEFVYAFIFLNKRMSRPVLEKYDFEQFPVLKEMKEYQFSENLLKKMNAANQYSKWYLSYWILGISMGNPSSHTKDFQTILALVEQIIVRFETLSGLKFDHRNEVIKQLYTHFRPAYYRLYFKLPIVNPFSEKIKREYTELYEIVEETLKPIEALFEHKIPEEEVAFLTMHFASLSQNFDEQKISKKVALIVCPNGIGSSSIVYTELKSTFPEFVFLGPVETNELDKLNESYDIIFSTVPNVRLFYSQKPVYIVNAIMDTAEKYRLVRDVYTEIGNLTFKLPNVQKIMNIVERHAEFKDKRSLEQELYDYFIGQEDETASSRKSSPTLAEITAPSLISMNRKARNWEEAIRISAAPLLTKRKITRHYVETMVENTKKDGPYMVITKHVALPHARPADGVKQLAISITSFSTPVTFGSSENDPVKYIFCLASKDNSTHINAMAELVKLLGDPEFYRLLDTCQDSQIIYDYIKTANGRAYFE